MQMNVEVITISDRKIESLSHSSYLHAHRETANGAHVWMQKVHRVRRG